MKAFVVTCKVIAFYKYWYKIIVCLLIHDLLNQSLILLKPKYNKNYFYNESLKYDNIKMQKNTHILQKLQNYADDVMV